MLKINLIAIGDIKETYLTDAIKEYSKRLSRFCQLKIIQLKETVARTNNKQDVLNALKKDAENETSISSRTVYWRMGVEWCTVLWKDEKFSTNEIVKFVQYIKDNNVTELTEERRAEIRSRSFSILMPVISPTMR